MFRSILAPWKCMEIRSCFCQSTLPSKFTMVTFHMLYLKNHRMVWVRKDPQDHLVLMALLWPGTPSIRPHCSKLIQPSLEHFQGQGKYSFSGLCCLSPMSHFVLEITSDNFSEKVSGCF